MAKKAKKGGLRDKFNAAYTKMKKDRYREKSGGCSCGGKGCSKCSCG